MCLYMCILLYIYSIYVILIPGVPGNIGSASQFTIDIICGVATVAATNLSNQDIGLIYPLVNLHI